MITQIKVGPRFSCKLLTLSIPVAISSGCALPEIAVVDIGDQAATCSVTRKECIKRNGLGCVQYDAPTNFTATGCTDPSRDSSLADTCRRLFCSKTDGLLYQNGSCTTTVLTNSTYPTTIPGICRPDPDSHFQAFVTFRQRFRTCTVGTDGTPCGQISQATSPDTLPETTCIDVSEARAALQLLPSTTVPVNATPSAIVNPSVFILDIDRDVDSCPLSGPASQSQQLNYAFAEGSMGSASAGATTVPLIVTQGIASIRPDCDGEYCTYELEQLKVSVADTTVMGVSLTGLTIRSVGSVAIAPLGSGHGQIATGALKLFITGRINGSPSALRVENNAPWSADVGNQQLSLNGTVKVISQDAQGKALPITATVNVSVPKATAQQVACASTLPVERVFGFEDRANWTSANASLALVRTPTTQGCGALGVSGQGYMSINGSSFATPGLVLKPALSVDLFVPSSQPNPFWLGALQIFLSCPSGGVFNQYVGQVEVSGLAQNAFSSLRFPLPAQTTNTLKRALSDCAFSFALNVNQTNRTWELDNLRFTP